MIMFLLVLLFIIIGDFMDAVPAIIIFMPIIIKLNELGNIKPLHMGVVIITTLVFGLITPPYGLSLLVASKFVGVRFSQGDVCVTADLCRVLRRDRLHGVFPGHRTLFAEASASGIGWLLQEPDRNGLYLPTIGASARAAQSIRCDCRTDRARAAGRSPAAARLR